MHVFVIAVYLLEEVCQMARGGLQEVGPIVQFTITRLSLKSPVVKQKVRGCAVPLLPLLATPEFPRVLLHPTARPALQACR